MSMTTEKALLDIGFKCRVRARCGKLYFTIRHNGWSVDGDIIMNTIQKQFPKAHMTSGAFLAGGTVTIASS